MARHDFDIPVTFKHRICFGRGVFQRENSLVGELLTEGGGRRVLVVVESAVAEARAGLTVQIDGYFADRGFDFRGVRILPGGEAAKNDEALVRRVWREIDAARIDRHSYVLAVGGGAFLDAVGFAAATAHRGVRLLRFPTTTLAQDDSGVGVKCAINHFGKKNWVGSFVVPYAVVNDFSFLDSQDEETRRAGLVEAIKVALVKDGEFFQWIRTHVEELEQLDAAVVEKCVERSALAHARHIVTGGDPFETGSSRPLDFGHWAGHKLEQLSDFRVSHAHGVAVGVALDTLYSAEIGLLGRDEAAQVLEVLESLRLPLWDEALDLRDGVGRRRIYEGLEEFREHLGGTLTVLMLRALGAGVDVHEIDQAVMERCFGQLQVRGGALVSL